MIGNNWDTILDTNYIGKMLDWVNSKRAEGQNILPEENEVLQALKLTDPNSVKVVIVGQDPYSGRDRKGTWHATGLAFSSKSECEIPPVLKNIFKELTYELEIYNRISDLTKWANQGVLLLNTIMTVVAEQTSSHKNMGWEVISSNVIQHLGKSEQPIVFMLWGKQAHGLEKHIRNDGTKLILKAAHPSPLSANNGFFGCNHFVLANHFLSEKGIDQIDWRL